MLRITYGHAPADELFPGGAAAALLRAVAATGIAPAPVDLAVLRAT